VVRHPRLTVLLFLEFCFYNAIWVQRDGSTGEHSFHKAIEDVPDGRCRKKSFSCFYNATLFITGMGGGGDF
jgi:hypothetical protein